MTRNSRQDNRQDKDPEEQPPAAAEPASDHIAPVPRISVQAFCESEDTATAIRSAGEDRRLAKAHFTVKMGGIAHAIDVYQKVPTPNVILLETDGHSDVLDALDQLAGVCDPGTRVIVIGNPEDDVSYRELVRRGINDYVIGPIEPLDAIRSICSLFSAADTVPTGRIIAVVGAKGGVGASTLAHNVAWMIARDLALDSVVIDLDLAFGTAGLDYNKDPLQGIANAVFQPDRPDTALMERLYAKCADNLNLLAAPATLERVYDFGAEAFDAIFDTLRMSTPCIVLDVPHQWSAWTKRVLISADEILVVAEPDLANLRNAKNLLKELKSSRPNDRPPLYCINQIGLPKRPEITVKEFAKAMESQPIAAIPFDSRIFGTAANNGQMVAEISAAHRTTKTFLQIARVLTGRGEEKSQRSLLAPLFRTFKEKLAPRRKSRVAARQ